ncbi:MAG: hypothetical protein JSR18_04330, partial [Proteobacteria bacterium]|nr:hypothetical protein [Pseudomonadota bacterium]
RGLEQARIFGAFFPSILLLRATAESSARVARLRREMAALTPAQTRLWTLLGSHALGAILSVGAMAIIAPVVTHDADEPRRAVLATAAAQGVGTAIMWSPFFIAMAFVSQLAPTVPLWQSILVGLGPAVIGVLVSHWLYARAVADGAGERRARPPTEVAWPTLFMVVAVVGATMAFHLSGLEAVSLVLPVVCAAYLLLASDASATEVSRRTFANFCGLSDEPLIVAGSTLLGVAVSSLPALAHLASGITAGHTGGALLIAIMVPALVMLGQVGLHPMVGASVLVPLLAAHPSGISPPVLVAGAVFAWGLSAAISIWTLPVASAATSFGVPVTRLWTRQSVVYAATVGAGGVVYLCLLNAWLMHGVARAG